ncbi:MAG: hypothetical protein IPM29_28540 [Planctomycetes bacterium]|nr:hypothetical protein [Planctomycetota bacterium]
MKLCRLVLSATPAVVALMLTSGVRAGAAWSTDARVLQSVQQDRPVRDQDPELRGLRRQLATLRAAAETHTQAGDEAAAESVRRAMHRIELQIQLARAREAEPEPAEMRELLARAARLRNAQGNAEVAKGLADLARTWGAPERGADRTEPAPRPLDLDQLGHRIEVLKMAHAAFRNAGKGDAADYTARFVHVAKLQLQGLQGVDPETIRQAVEGLDTGRTIELLRAASGLFEAAGKARPARACNALADWYARRERERAGSTPPTEPRRLDVQQLADRVAILRIARDVFAEAGAERAVASFDRLIHLGELLVEGVEPGDQRVRDAVKEATPDLAERVDLLRKAAELAGAGGHPDRARACTALADHYAGERR